MMHRLTPLAATVLLFSSTAAQAQDHTLILEEIVVTAQKKVESLSETPMTVNVISGDQFSEFASFDLRDLDRFTAGVALTGLDFDVDVAVRGLGSNLNAAVDPRVTFYWDGAYSVRQLANFVSQFDLERFELLRGPQGTLYGKSSPAGALTMQSRNPNMEKVDGFIQQAFSERQGANTQAGISIPVVENVFALRFSGVYDENRNQDIENITLDIDNAARTRGGRVVALWQAADALDLRLSYNYVRADKNIDSIVEGNGLSFTERKAVNDYAANSFERHSQLVFEVNWELPNEWLMTWVSSEQESLMNRDFDSDFTEVQGQNQFVSSNIFDTFNTEVRLQSTDNAFWDWTAGLFYQDSSGETPVFVDNFLVVGTPSPVYLPLVAEVTGPAINDSRDFAIFLHNAFHLSEEGTLTVGIRYNEITRFNKQDFLQEAYLLQGENGDERVGPVDISVAEGVPKDVQNLDYNAFTGTLKYQHNLSDNLMLYGAYDRGWRSGSANIAGQPAPPEWADFESETSDNLEIGMKWTFLEGRGLFNLTGYYQLYNDFHFGADSVLYVLDDNSFAQGSPVINADEVSSTGFEAEVSYLLAENWTSYFAISYNRTRFESFPDAPCNDPEQPPINPGDYGTCDLKGAPAGNQPEWSAVLTSDYALPLANGQLEWYLRGLLKAEGERDNQSLGVTLQSYAFLDLFTGLRGASGRWDISVWAKNLLDDDARLNINPALPVPDYSVIGQIPDTNIATIDTGWTRVSELLAPRTLGATLALRF